MNDELESILSDESPQRRGLRFEVLIAKLFREAGFQAIESSGVAAPRQTDVLAFDSATTYLIEVKMTAARADVGVIDEVRLRLDRGPVTSLGLVVSWSGFSEEAMDEVVQHRSRPILLMDQRDVELALDQPRELRSRLLAKRDDLTIHGRVLLGQERPQELDRRIQLGRDVMSADQTRFIVDLDGRRLPWLEGPGGFTQSVFVEDLPDVDWTPAGGRGMTTEFGRIAQDQQELIERLTLLAGAGWIGNDGTWVIDQETRSWQGIGATSLIAALESWQERYVDLDRPHHVEVIHYVGESFGDVLCLVADISADDTRWCRRADLGLQTMGLPIDPQRYVALARDLGAQPDHRLRPLSRSAVTTYVPRDRPSIVIEPMAYVVSVMFGEPWVSSVMAPIPSRWPEMRVLDDVEDDVMPLDGGITRAYGCFRLSDRYALDDLVTTEHRLERVEVTQLAGSTICRASVRW